MLCVDITRICAPTQGTLLGSIGGMPDCCATCTRMSRVRSLTIGGSGRLINLIIKPTVAIGETPFQILRAVTDQSLRLRLFPLIISTTLTKMFQAFSRKSMLTPKWSAWPCW